MPAMSPSPRRASQTPGSSGTPNTPSRRRPPQVEVHQHGAAEVAGEAHRQLRRQGRLPLARHGAGDQDHPRLLPFPPCGAAGGNAVDRLGQPQPPGLAALGRRRPSRRRTWAGIAGTEPITDNPRPWTTSETALTRRDRTSHITTPNTGRQKPKQRGHGRSRPTASHAGTPPWAAPPSA